MVPKMRQCKMRRCVRRDINWGICLPCMSLLPHADQVALVATYAACPARHFTRAHHECVRMAQLRIHDLYLTEDADLIALVEERWRAPRGPYLDQIDGLIRDRLIDLGLVPQDQPQ